MKGRSTTQFIALAAVLISVLILCGFSFSEVKLKSNRPLIDLQETVKESSFGDDDTMTETDTKEGEEVDETLSEETEPVNTILIREQNVYYNNIRQTDISGMIGKIRGQSEDISVVLTDDYADYKNYKAVRDALIEAGIPFTEEMMK
ncbi:MAG: hypothetical protein K6C95_01280 [Lachnospiraceae bacterium]|nr:hypothetical protein [Lachnospiraceae bacterium]